MENILQNTKGVIMKKSLIVIVILLSLLSACKNGESYKFDQSYLKILNVEISTMPEGQIEFRSFTNGESSLLMNDDFLKAMKFNIEGQETKLHSVSQEKDVAVDVFIFSNITEKNTILSDKKVKNYDLYVNYPTNLEKIESSDASLFEELKENIKKGGSDNFAKNIFKFLQGVKQDRNEKLFIVFIDSNRLEDDAEFSKYYDKINKLAADHSNWWFGIFSNEDFSKLDNIKNHSIPENCLFIENLQDTDQQLRFIESSIEKIENSRYLADFSFVGLSNPLKTEYQVRMFSVIDDEVKNKLSDIYIFKINSDKLKNYYLAVVESRINELITNYQYEAALDKLSIDFDLTKYPELRDKAHRIIINWFIEKNETLKYNSGKADYDEGLDFIIFVEKKWDPVNLPWYKNLKVEFLILYSDFQKAKGYAYSERMKIYDEILSLDPGNVNVTFNLYECKGDSFISAKDIVTGISWYKKALNEKSDPQLKEKLLRNLKELIEEYHTSKSYQLLNDIAQLYSSYIADNFNIRYYWANAAYKIHSTSQALKQYNWLIDNWKSNSLISWNELLNNLFNVYAEDMNFDEAYNLLKRIAINNQGNEESPDIMLALSYLRGKYIKPFIMASEMFFSSINSSKIKYLSDQLEKSDLPAYIQAIYTISGNSVKSILYPQNAKVILPPTNYDTKPQTFSKEGNNCWYIRNIQDGYLVLQTNNSVLSNGEAVRLTELKNNYTNPSEWFELEEYLFDYQKQTTVRLLGIMIGVDYYLNEISVMDEYAEVLQKTIPNYEYFSIQNKENRIVYSKDFNQKNAFYHNEGWSASSKAILIFSQEIEYDGSKITDIAYPITINENWLGVIRFGFERY